MILHSYITGDGPTLVILHGLFGSWENWGSQIRKLEANYRVIGLDLPNHGESDHCDEMSYDSMADDVLQTLAHLRVNEYHLLGHSMGGKVAMTIAGRAKSGTQKQFATQYKNAQVSTAWPNLSKLIIVDIAPRQYEPHHHQILAAMLDLNVSELTSRSQADQALQGAIPELPIRQFILKNLQRSDKQGFQWKLNLPVIDRDYHKLLSMPAAEVMDLSNPVLVLRGTESDYVSAADEASLANRFTNLQVISIEGAGHWPHASHALQVHETISQFLSN